MKNNNRPKVKLKDRKVVQYLKENVPTLAGNILKVAGDVTGVEILENVGDMINKNQTIKQEQKEKALSILHQEILEERKLQIQDLDSARHMQETALQQVDIFSKRFIYYFAIFWSVVAGSYIFAVTFFNITNTRAADTILGFMLGTIIASIIAFFYGSSAGSKHKDNLINVLQDSVNKK